MDEPLGLNTIETVGSELNVRDGILRLQERLRMLPQGTYPVTHHFADGQYAREIFIPKHSIVIGKIHKHAHPNVISLGDVTVVTEFGIKRMKAPLTFVSQPGTKRALITHEDTIWTTNHLNPTNTKDLLIIEEDIIAPTYEAYDELAFKRNLDLASQRIVDALENDPS